MALDKNSKIKDVWRHPAGRDILRRLLLVGERGTRWLQNPLVANQPITLLERFAGPGFVDAMLEIINAEPEEKLSVLPSARPVWWKDAVAYRVYLPSFMDSDHDGVGDICGLIQRLPYLAKLGVNLLWLCPFLEGQYGGTEPAKTYLDINNEFGCTEDLEALAEAAHEQDMRVVMDINITSTSELHQWFKKAKNKEGAFENYYIFEKGEAAQPPNNWGPVPFGSAWKWFADMQAWGLSINKAGMLDLNWGNPEVRKDIAGTLNYWLEKGLDGFCFTSVNTIAKNSMEDGNEGMAAISGMHGFEKFVYGKELHSYLKELRGELQSTPDALLVGNILGLGTGMAKLLVAGGQELDMVQDSSHLLPGAKTRKQEDSLSLLELKNYFTRWMEQYGNDGWMPLFLENSNTSRMLSRLGASPVYKGILAKLLGTMLLTLRGMPVVYQGQELGMMNTRFSSAEELRDPGALRLYHDLLEWQGEEQAFDRAVQTTADHARVPIPWNASHFAGFTGAEPWLRVADGFEYLNAAAQMEDDNSVWRHYQKLIKLRRKNDCLKYGSFVSVFAQSRRVFCYFRIYEGEKWYVEMNLTEKEVTRQGRIMQNQKLVLSNYDTPSRVLRPYEANLYLCE